MVMVKNYYGFLKDRSKKILSREPWLHELIKCMFSAHNVLFFLRILRNLLLSRAIRKLKQLHGLFFALLKLINI